MKRLTVLIQKLDADFRPNQAILHFLLDELLHAALQIIRKVLNEREDFLNRCSLDDFLNEIVVGLVIVRINMNFGDTAEEVVNVTEDVLIGAHQEETRDSRALLHSGDAVPARSSYPAERQTDRPFRPNRR